MTLPNNRNIALDRYHVLVHLTKDESGNPINWVGCFGSLNSQVAEGFAFEAVLCEGQPILKRIRDGCTVRLYTQKIAFTPFDFFAWRRREDDRTFEYRDGTMSFMCLQISTVPEWSSQSDPEFKKLKRAVVTLTPVVENGRPTIAVSFADE